MSQSTQTQEGSNVPTVYINVTALPAPQQLVPATLARPSYRVQVLVPSHFSLPKERKDVILHPDPKVDKAYVVNGWNGFTEYVDHDAQFLREFKTRYESVINNLSSLHPDSHLLESTQAEGTRSCTVVETGTSPTHAMQHLAISALTRDTFQGEWEGIPTKVATLISPESEFEKFRRGVAAGTWSVRVLPASQTEEATVVSSTCRSEDDRIQEIADELSQPFTEHHIVVAAQKKALRHLENLETSRGTSI